MKRSAKDKNLRDEYDFSDATRGSVVTNTGIKLPVTIRLDGDIIDFFKDAAEALGEKAKYQTLINEALKEYVAGAKIQKILLSDEFVSRLSQRIKNKMPPAKKKSSSF
jgi:uncharacterized protein (DUF4415 family)